MKKICSFTIPVLLVFIFAGCSKDFLKRYEERIEGTWNLSDVDRRGWNTSTSSVHFRDGTFIFSDDGSLEYINATGERYQGSWNIRKRWVTGNCYTDDNGNYNCDDRYIRSLQILAINFVTQDVITEFFDDIIFTGTNRFNAFIYTGNSTYIYRFRR
jgi:hypothetical protein